MDHRTSNAHDQEWLPTAAEINRPADWAWAAAHFVIVLVLVFTLISIVGQLVMDTTRLVFPVPGVAVVVSAVTAFLATRAMRKRRVEQLAQRYRDRIQRGLCPRCEYDLNGLVDLRCPECGSAIPEFAFDSRSLSILSRARRSPQA